MPRRNEPPRSGRLNEQTITQLAENVRGGLPFRQPQAIHEERGYGDLIFIDSGGYYPIACDFIHGKDDTETLVAIWSELREDIIDQHIKHRPGTRPWGWWFLEDREPRRRLTRKPCTCPPVAIHPERPVAPSQLSLSRSGRPYGCRCEYESEGRYLKRLNLLTIDEGK